LIQNQKLLNRIAILIAQTFAVSPSQVLTEMQKSSIENVIEKFEHPENNITY